MHKSYLLLITVAALCQSPVDARPVKGKPAVMFYRKDNGAFHHFTIYDGEIQNIRASNKWYEYGPQFYAFDHQVPGLVPFYRLQKAGDHFFTVDATERLNAMKTYGYSNENICCYISAGPIPGTIPLFRIRKGGIHIYLAELPTAGLGGNGWTVEGIAGYVWAARDPSGNPTLPPPVLQEP